MDQTEKKLIKITTNIVKEVETEIKSLRKQVKELTKERDNLKLLLSKTLKN